MDCRSASGLRAASPYKRRDSMLPTTIQFWLRSTDQSSPRLPNINPLRAPKAGKPVAADCCGVTP